MAEQVIINKSILTDIGNAIREKKGTTDLIPSVNMASEIESIESGGDGAAEELWNEDSALLSSYWNTTSGAYLCRNLGLTPGKYVFTCKTNIVSATYLPSDITDTYAIYIGQIPGTASGHLIGNSSVAGNMPTRYEFVVNEGEQWYFNVYGPSLEVLFTRLLTGVSFKQVIEGEESESSNWTEEPAYSGQVIMTNSGSVHYNTLMYFDSINGNFNNITLTENGTTTIPATNIAYIRVGSAQEEIVDKQNVEILYAWSGHPLKLILKPTAENWSISFYTID